MKNYALFLLFSVVLFTACTSNDDDDDNQIIGSGNIISEMRDLDEFQSVDITGVFSVTITAGDPQSVVVEADDNIINRITTEVRQNTLEVGLQSGNYADGFTANVTIQIPTLLAVNNLGVSNVGVSGFAGQQNLSVSNTGVGTLTLSGNGTNLSLTNTGTGLINGFNYISDTCTVNQTGVGNMEVTCNDLLAGTLTGVGNIFYKGQPVVNVTVTGVGSVIDAN